MTSLGDGFERVAPFLQEPLVLIGFVVALFLGLLKLLVKGRIIPGLDPGGGFRILRLLINYGFVLALLVVLLGFILKLKQGAPRSEIPGENASEEVEALKTQVIGLRGTYESITEPNDPAKVIVRDEAPRIGRQLLNLADRNLQDGEKLSKYSYGGMSYVLAGQTEDDAELAGDYARSACAALEAAENLITTIRSAANGSDPYYTSLVTWIDEQNFENWVRYNVAIALAMRAKSRENIGWAEIEKQLRPIARSYLARYPLKHNPELLWACTTLSGSLTYCGGR